MVPGTVLVALPGTMCAPAVERHPAGRRGTRPARPGPAARAGPGTSGVPARCGVQVGRKRRPHPGVRDTRGSGRRCARCS